MITGLVLIGLLQAAPNAPALDIDSMVPFPTSVFQMGTPDTLMVGRYGDGWYVNETPQRDVSLAAFAMDRHEVSVGEFALFLTHACGDACYDERMPIDKNDDGYHSQEEASSLPITWVDWRSASWYCTWAGKRLPTEAEWEFTATGTEGRPWPWGDATGPRCSFSTYSFDGGRCDRTLRPRDAHADGETPNGVRNLSGNAAEWTSDDYAAYPSEGAAIQPGPAEGAHRVIRGGSFLTSRRQLQPRSRRGAPTATRSVDLGFRCAWDDSIQDPAGVTRGELSSPDPDGLMPRSETVDEDAFDVIAAGLNGARALTVLDGTAYIAGNESTYVWNDGSTIELPELRVAGWTTDDSYAFGIDTDNGKLWRIDAGQAELEADMPGLISAVSIPGGWAWTDGASIWSRGLDGEDVEVVTGRVEVNRMVIIGDQLYWSEGGQDGGAVLEVPLVGGEPRQLVGPPQLGQPLKAWSLTADGVVRLWFMVGFQGQWPFSGLLCRTAIQQERLECVTHSPPKSNDLALADGAVHWRHQYGVSTYGGGTPYSSLGDPVSTTGFMVTPDAYWVTETATGRLLRRTR